MKTLTICENPNSNPLHFVCRSKLVAEKGRGCVSREGKIVVNNINHEQQSDLSLGTGKTVVLTVQAVLLGPMSIVMYVLSRPAASHSFSYKWGAAGWRE
jgi:hypothetical protein